MMKEISLNEEKNEIYIKYQIYFNILRFFLVILLIYISYKSNIIKIEKIEREKNYKYFFCFCSLGKSENKYVKQLVDYYKNIGVNKFYLGDNNDKDSERLSDVLTDEISSGLVEIIDLTGINIDQLDLFINVYDMHKHECKWMSFFDFDEYLTILPEEKNITLEQYFSNEKFDKCNVILVNWLLYKDNDLIKYDNRTLRERFTEPSYHHPNNRFIKSIIRGNIRWNPWTLNQTCHRPKHQLRTCDSNGDRAKTFNDVLKPPILDNVILKHYVTKTAEEYYTKIKRGYTRVNKKLEVYIDNYFRLNKINKEKVKFFEEKFNTTFTRYHMYF